MPALNAASFDAIVTDPPYGLSFMGKSWDHGIPSEPFWTAALRVAKPGAHLVAFGGTRTYHRLTCAIEDAGWEIRDCLSWLYGSGFPKSHDVSKAIDKSLGHVRPRVPGGIASNGIATVGMVPGEAISGEAARWNGWGTALKPAWEPIILARKPLIGTVAANVQEHGTGGLNVDGCRVKFADQEDQAAAAAAAAQRAGHDQNEGRTAYGRFENGPASIAPYLAKMDAGRWPANVVLDDEAARMLDEQSGELSVVGGEKRTQGSGGLYQMGSAGAPGVVYHDHGGASRFFYTAKASRAERNAGLDGFPERDAHTLSGGVVIADGRTAVKGKASAQNHHPTVKPLDLMQWLCRLVTPKGGLILDPFCGSGTTGRAAVAEGFRFVGIEKEAEYVEIARARIAEYAPLFNGGAA